MLSSTVVSIGQRHLISTVLYDVNVNGMRADTYRRRADAERARDKLRAGTAQVFPHRASGCKVSAF